MDYKITITKSIYQILPKIIIIKAEVFNKIETERPEFSSSSFCTVKAIEIEGEEKKIK